MMAAVTFCARRLASPGTLPLDAVHDPPIRSRYVLTNAVAAWAGRSSAAECSADIAGADPQVPHRTMIRDSGRAGRRPVCRRNARSDTSLIELQVGDPAVRDQFQHAGHLFLLQQRKEFLGLFDVDGARLVRARAGRIHPRERSMGARNR